MAKAKSLLAKYLLKMIRGISILVAISFFGCSLWAGSPITFSRPLPGSWFVKTDQLVPDKNIKQHLLVIQSTNLVYTMVASVMPIPASERDTDFKQKARNWCGGAIDGAAKGRPEYRMKAKKLTFKTVKSRDVAEVQFQMTSSKMILHGLCRYSVVENCGVGWIIMGAGVPVEGVKEITDILASIQISPASNDNSELVANREREELEEVYHRYARAFKDRSVEEILKFRTDDFVHKSSLGTSISREQHDEKIKQMFRIVKSVSDATIEITKVATEGDKHIATVTTKLALVIVAPDGKEHEMVEIENSRDTWIKIGGVLKLKQIETLGGSVTVDGRPLRN